MSEESKKIEAIFMKSYEDNSDALFRYCYFHTSDRQLALDLLQDTFIKTWQYLQDGKDIQNIRAFLYKVAKNLIIDYRRKKHGVSLESITETGIDFKDERLEEEVIANNFDQDFVRKKIDDLEEEHREILILRYLNEMSIKEIADTLNITPNNVSVKIHRAVEKMKDLLEDYNETQND